MLVFFFFSTAAHWLVLTSCQVLSNTPPVWLTLANAIRNGGIPDDWTGCALPYVAVHEGINVLAMVLGVRVAGQPRRASASLTAYCFARMAEALLDAGVWWSLGAVRNHLRIAETLGILGQLSLPFAWLWFAGRANAFRYPLRMFIAVTLFGYAGDAAVGFISDGAECIMVGRLSYGYLSHRTIPMALLALALLLPACAVLKRPWAARRWLVILSTGIIGGSILPAVPAYYNGFIFDPFDVAAFELAPLLYLAQTIAAFVLVARERYRPDDAPACLTCGYNLTGNVSGVCPECGVRVRMEGAVGPGQAGQ